MAINKGGSIALRGSYTGTTQGIFAEIAGRKENSTDNNERGYLQFAVNGTGGLLERMRINSEGNVGIGTTSPGAKLDVNGTVFARGALRALGSIDQGSLGLDRIDLGVQDGTPRMVFENSGSTNWLIDNDGTKFRWYIPGVEQMNLSSSSNDATLALLSDNTSGISLNSNGNSYLMGGNVGIGTTSPGGKLHIVDSTGTALRISSPSGATYWNIGRELSYGGLTFSDNGVENLRITTDGNVGIGTTSPGAGLHISADAANYVKIFDAYNGSGGTGNVLWVQSSNNSSSLLTVKGTGTANLVDIFDNTTNVFTIKDGGNVGIGTTSPGAKLTVVGQDDTTGLALDLKNNSGNSKFSINDYGALSNNPYILWDGTSVRVLSSAGRLNVTGSTTDYAFYANQTSTGDIAQFQDGGNAVVVIKDGGNVGIGTTGPSEKLQVNGTVRSTAFKTDGGNLLQHSAAGNDWTFKAGGVADRMVITNTGNVGIGTTGPGAKLDVFGDVKWGTGATPSVLMTTGDIQLEGNKTLRFSSLDGTIQGTSVGIFINPRTNTGTFFQSGNVGIGTTSPGTKLDVVTSGYPVLRLERTGVTSPGNWQFWLSNAYGGGDGTLNLVPSATTGDFNILNSVLQSKFYVDTSTGNVGIGTTGPGAKLDVIGSIRSTTTSTAGLNNVYSHLTGNTASDATNYFRAGLFQAYGTNGGYTNSGYLKGFETEALIRDAGTTAGVYGATFSVGNYAAGGTDPEATITTLYGANYALYNQPLSTIGNAYGNLITLPSAGTITGSMYGINIGANSLASGTAKYGIYIGAMSGATANYGIYSNGGTNYFSGNVGIGTTSPGAKLQVVGNSDSVAALKLGPSATYGWKIYERNTDGDLQIKRQENSVESDVMYFKRSTGNVGIGTTSPGAKLHVNTTTNEILRLQTSLDTGGWIQFQEGSTVQGYIGMGTGNSIFTDQTTDSLAIRATNALHLGSGTGSDVTISTAGNVGIGTTTPDKILVVGNVAGALNNQIVIDGADNRQATLTFRSQTGNEWYVGRGDSDVLSNSSFFIGNYINTTNNAGGSAAKFVINSTGNVGIGTTSPEQLLTLSGGVNQLQLQTSDYVVNTTGSRLRIGFGASTGNTFAKIQTTDAGGASASDLVLQADSGNVGIGTTSPGALLDVAGSIRGGGIFYPDYVTDVGTYIAGTEANKLKLYSDSYITGNVGGNERLVLNSFGDLQIDGLLKSDGTGNSYMLGNVGIGTTSPSQKLSVGSSNQFTVSAGGNVSTTGSVSSSSIYVSSDTVTAQSSLNFADDTWFHYPYQKFTRYRGAITSPAPVQVGDIVGATNFYGYGAGGSVVGVAGFSANVDGINGDYLLGKLTFSVSAGVDGGSNFNAFNVTSTTSTFYTANNVFSGIGNTTIAGNVGIGTTNPRAKLDFGTFRQLPSVSFRNDGGTDALSGVGIDLPGGSESFASNYYFGTNVAAHLSFGTWDNTTFVEKVRIQSSGNVGIGTTSPGSPLTVSGTGGTSAGPSTLSVLSTSDGSFVWGSSVLASSLSAGNHVVSFVGRALSIKNSAYLGFKYAGSGSDSNLLSLGMFGADDLMVIQGDGNVGIGTTNPLYKLDVKSTGTDIARFQGSNSTGCTLSDGGVIACSSDVNLKKNISSIEYGLATLLSLRPVEYNWKSENNSVEKSLGFIAQEVESLIPKLVTTDSNGLKQLNTIGLVPVAIKAIQEQQTQITGITNNQNKIVDQLTGQLADQTLSVDNKLQLIGASLDALTTEQIEKLKDQIADNKANISGVTAELEKLQEQYDTIQDQYLALSEILSVTTGVYDFKEAVLKSRGIVSGAFAVKVVDKNSSTIGQSAICKASEALEEDGTCVTYDSTDSGLTQATGKLTVIKTTAVSADSRIFVTPKVVTDQPLAVTDIVPGVSFSVEVKNSVDESISFDWFIVEEK